jgi:hypothetical protein
MTNERSQIFRFLAVVAMGASLGLWPWLASFPRKSPRRRSTQLFTKDNR